MQQAPLQQLLGLLHSDRRDAGEAYRDLHARLARFFRFNGTQDPEALADEAMDRLAKRVAAEGEEPLVSPQAFALGIARHLLREDARRRTRESETAAQWSELTVRSDEEREELLQAIERCLARMSRDQRELLRSYYQWHGRAKIEHHRALAEQLKVSQNALRNRLMRARRLLDECVRHWRGDVSGKPRTEEQKRRID